MTAMQIIKTEFEGAPMTFNDEGWFDATLAAAKFGKRPADWLKQNGTLEYMASLSKHLGISDSKSLIRARRNSGTWLHPKLAVAFARWLCADFAVWCDLQIDAILRGKIDTQKLRSEAASSFKVMTSVLQLVREEQGKVTAAHHYSNEARLINYAVSGKFQSLDRDALTSQELHLLAKLEEKNAVLIGRSVGYEDRKKMLEQYAIDLRSGAVMVTVTGR